MQTGKQLFGKVASCQTSWFHKVMKTAYRYVGKEELKQIQLERKVTRMRPNSEPKEWIYVSNRIYGTTEAAMNALALPTRPFAVVTVQIP